MLSTSLPRGPAQGALHHLSPMCTFLHLDSALQHDVDHSQSPLHPHSAVSLWTVQTVFSLARATGVPHLLTKFVPVHNLCTLLLNKKLWDKIKYHIFTADKISPYAQFSRQMRLELYAFWQYGMGNFNYIFNKKKMHWSKFYTGVLCLNVN